MFGIHIKKDFELGKFASLDKSINNLVDKYAMDVCQVFLYGPQSRRKNDYDEKAIAKLGKNVSIFVHSTYITDGYWGAVSDNNATKLKSHYKHIQDQLNATNNINGKGLVIHITRKPIDVIVAGMRLLENHINQHAVKIILEFKAMKPSDSSYEKVDKVNELAAALSGINLDWGFCLDTSHMWSTGIEMQNQNVVAEWFGAIKKDKVVLIHLNAASNDTFGVGRDIHQVPFSEGDDIWGDVSPKSIKSSSIGFILDWAKKNKVPLIGEFNRGTDKEFKDAIKVIKKYLAGN